MFSPSLLSGLGELKDKDSLRLSSVLSIPTAVVHANEETGQSRQKLAVSGGWGKPWLPGESLEWRSVAPILARVWFLFYPTHRASASSHLQTCLDLSS